MRSGIHFRIQQRFEDVLMDVKRQFQEELVKEKIAMHMSGYVRIEKNPFVRAVPLEIKKYFLMIGANLGSRSITAVYSNIGIIRFPEEYKEYIQHFGIFASTNSLQMCSCSYGDEMVLGFTSKIPDDSIQRNFQRMLSEEEVSHRELKNEFPAYGEKQKTGEKRKPESRADIQFFVPGSCCHLWNDQFHDCRNIKLVLVCRCGMCLCMAGGYGGVFQTEEYSEE